MNMETLSNTDFERLEKLLYTKQFDNLSVSEKQWVESIFTKEEYASMWMFYSSLNKQNKSIDIEPQAETKEKLNRALVANVKRTSVFQIKMPMYQSVAAALIFFFVGFGINLSRPADTKIIHDTVQVIKYIIKTEPTKNITLKVPKYGKTKIKQNVTIAEPEKLVAKQSEKVTTMPESNSEFIRQQEIAMTNLNRVLNEQSGCSMAGDTVLQKMMVTLY